MNMKKYSGWLAYASGGLVAILLCALIGVHAAPSASVQITGTVAGPDGTPVNGKMVLTLSNPCQNTANNTQVAVYPIQYPVVNGTLPGYAFVVPNDACNPGGTYYVMNLYDTAGNPVAQANYYITSPGPFNIGQAAPTSLTTSQISYQNPAFTNVNNIWGGTQTFNGLCWTSATSFASCFLNSNTAARNYTFPDANGNVCISTNCGVTGGVFTNTSLQGVTQIGVGFFTAFNVSGQLTQYNGQATVGLPVEVAHADIASCPSSGPTTIATAGGSDSRYRFTYYLNTISGSGTDTLTISVSWKDASTTTQTVTSSTINLSTTGAFTQGSVITFPASGQNVTVSTTRSATTGTPTCGGQYTLEQF
jgi:hypothetical protein